MSIIFCNKTLKNPLLNASGNWISDDYQVRDLNNDPNISAIVLKTCTLNPRSGNPWPNFILNEHYAINNMGLPNNGFAYYSQMHKIYNEKPIILSIDGSITEDAIIMLKSYSNIIGSSSTGIVELNVSCPNLSCPKPIAISKRLLLAFLHQIFDNLSYPNLSIGLKLPPYFYEYKIAEIAGIINQFPQIAFITCCNTIPNALHLEPYVHGAISGSCNKPIAMANVKLFRKYLNQNIDIIGCGGVESMNDVEDYLKCGAKLVQIGTAFIKNKNVFKNIINSKL